MEPISELCAVNGFEIFLVRLVIMKIAATFKGNRFQPNHSNIYVDQGLWSM